MGRADVGIARKNRGYCDQVRDHLVAQKRQYRLHPVDDAEFLGLLQQAANWLTARKVLPEPVTVAEHVAQLQDVRRRFLLIF
jgi:sulfonate transport system substrate-binding protein